MVPLRTLKKASLRVFAYPVAVTLCAIIPGLNSFLFTHAGLGYLMLLVCFPYFLIVFATFCLSRKMTGSDLYSSILIIIPSYIGLTYLFSFLVVAGTHDVSNSELINIWNAFFFPIYFLWSKY